MALFRRVVSLHEAVVAIRGALADRPGDPLPIDLQELSESLRRREPPQAAWAPPAEPGAQALIDAFPDPAAIVEQGCRIASANPALDELLGGRGAGRTVLQATRSAELSECAARAIGGWAQRTEAEAPALGGKALLAIASPLPGSRALLVLRDLSASRRGEAVRRDFIANASHELRTPVSAISGAAETLIGIDVGEKGRPFVEMIARQAARLARLTSDLLDLSRLESGQWPIELGSYDVGAICEDALALVRERAAARHIALGSDVPGDLQVRCDARALGQILANFLDNAIKHTPETGRVTLLADSTHTHVIVSVLDTGPGIEARHHARIFERFYRADGGRARSDGGSGLGLAIVKHLAQAQGGDVGLESGKGGSRFWVRLPAGR